MDFSNYQFRCSSLGKLMTTAQKKEKEAGLPSKTTQSYLKEIYIEEVYGRRKDITSKYLEKGLLCEEDALGLLGQYDGGKLYIKNKDYFKNDFIKGTPDNTQGRVRDTKAPFTIHTFFSGELSKDYEWQLRGYMELTGLKELPAELAYCLVDTPPHILYDEQQRLKWKMGVIDEDNDQDYIEACKEIEKSGTFDDIPVEKKVRKYFVEHDDEKIKELYQRIEECRNFLNNINL